jgi:hypothetical protein
MSVRQNRRSAAAGRQTRYKRLYRSQINGSISERALDPTLKSRRQPTGVQRLSCSAVSHGDIHAKPTCAGLVDFPRTDAYLASARVA